ncbi:MAG: OmpA family protein [Gemmatimonadetes bacterium]|nr:OmpA family protein [Gemmatimonadota bacterium]
MGTMRGNWRGLGILSALSLAGAAGACKTVSPDELDVSLAALRDEITQQMRSGDQAVSQQLGGRIGTVEQRTAALETDLGQLEQDFEVTITRLENQLRFDVPVYFAFNDATVEKEDQALLDRFRAVAQEYYPQALITVEGFTDPAGSAEFNMALGLRRAGAVREYLVGTGVTADRIRAISYGEDTKRLVAPTGTGPGMAGWENRRVVLVIDHDGQAPAMPTIADDATE